MAFKRRALETLSSWILPTVLTDREWSSWTTDLGDWVAWEYSWVPFLSAPVWAWSRASSSKNGKEEAQAERLGKALGGIFRVAWTQQALHPSPRVRHHCGCCPPTSHTSGSDQQAPHSSLSNLVLTQSTVGTGSKADKKGLARWEEQIWASMSWEA